MWNVGSINAQVVAIIGTDNIPSSLSGTALNPTTELNINFVEQKVPETTNSDVIPEKYQPIVTNLTISDVLKAKSAQSGGVSDVSLGPLKVKAAGGDDAELAKQYREAALEELKLIQRKIRFTRSIGCWVNGK